LRRYNGKGREEQKSEAPGDGHRGYAVPIRFW